MPEVAGQSASADAPATDIDKQIADRIAGFQRLLQVEKDRNDRMEKELNEFKTANLSEEEREQLVQSEKDRRIATLEAQLELRQLSKDYPAESEFFETLLSAGTAKDQLEVMRAYGQSLLATQTPAAAPAPPAEPTTGSLEIDMNRPLRQPQQGVTLTDGRMMNDEIADAILGSITRQADVTQRKPGQGA